MATTAVFAATKKVKTIYTQLSTSQTVSRVHVSTLSQHFLTDDVMTVWNHLSTLLWYVDEMGSKGPDLLPPIHCIPGSHSCILGILPLVLFRLRNGWAMLCNSPAPHPPIYPDSHPFRTPAIRNHPAPFSAGLPPPFLPFASKVPLFSKCKWSPWLFLWVCRSFGDPAWSHYLSTFYWQRLTECWKMVATLWPTV